MARRTKIVATIGPSSSSPETLKALFTAGVDVARLNCSHGRAVDHLKMVPLVREAAASVGRNVAVLADLPGPKIRTTDMGDGVTFVDEAIVALRTGSQPSTATEIYTDYPSVADDLEPGDSVALGDGNVDLRVTGINGATVHCVVLNGGTMRARPGLHLPAERIALPVPTDEDRALIEAVALSGDVDFIGVSFVRHPSEIRTVRELLGDSDIKIIAKIETPQAIDNLEEIVELSDAVMVARGDLGTECPFEDVPVYQKRIIRHCLAHATPVITATQMMESMITASTPTRAEASDVANAVCDGTDAIMLSGETAIGNHPVLVVEAMARIAEAAEIVANYDHMAASVGAQRSGDETTGALTHGAWYAMNDARVRAVLCCTRSGATAYAMAALRPDANLVVLSTNEHTVRQQALTWGADGLGLPEVQNPDDMARVAVERAKSGGFVRAGDVVAVLSGVQDVPGATNSLRMLTVD